MSGYLIHNVVSMRAEPDIGSEQISQGIMGDTVTVLENSGNFARVRTFDAYEGWMLRSQIRLCEPGQEFDSERMSGRIMRMLRPINSVRSAPPEDAGTSALFPFWTPYFEAEGETDDHEIFLPNSSRGFLKESFSSRIQTHRRDVRLASILAGQFIGTPYLWGGTTPFGFDCSGYVQALYRAIGVVLPRDAYQQAASPLGSRLSETATPEAGDLVFFLGAKDLRNRGITHVGMALDDAHFIHAYGKTGVVLSSFDEDEIKSAYQYRGAWRLNAKEESTTEK